MKRTTLLLSCFAFLFSALAFADDFQGTAHMKITSSKNVIDMDYVTKPGFVKTSFASPKGGTQSMIFDVANRQTIIVMDQRRMYMINKLPTVAPTLRNPNAGDAKPIVDTGTTETILGYKCTKYTVPGDNSTVEIWATSELGNFAGFAGAGAGAAGRRPSGPPTDWAKAVQGRGFFPLRIIETQNGAEKFRMEITSLQKQAIADSEFAPPAGYQEFNVGNMMGAAFHPPGQ